MKIGKKKLQKAFNKLVKKVISENKFRLENNFDYNISIYKTRKELIGTIGIDIDDGKPRIFFCNEIGSLYTYTKNDKKFRAKWDKKINKILAKQYSCKMCKKEWNKKEKIIPQLHHYKMKQKNEQNLKEIERRVYIPILKGNLTLEQGYKKYKKIKRKLLAYYKSLKDTEVICFLCHIKEDGTIERIENYKQVNIDKIKKKHITLDKFFML